MPIFKDVETEVHFTPSIISNPLHNARLQKWFADNLHLMRDTEEDFTVPTPTFNIVYICCNIVIIICYLRKLVCDR